MQHKLTIKDLDEFGLNSYEARSYLSLLEKNRLTASEVSRLAGIPRARVYETLEHLEAKGLCQAMPGKVKIYTAVDPSLLKNILIRTEKDRLDSKIQKLQLEIQKEKDRLVEKIKTAENLTDRLLPIFEKGREVNDNIDYIEIVKDPILIHNKVCDLLANAKTEVLGFTKPPYTVVEKMPEQTNYSHVALRKGVAIRNVYEIPRDKGGLKHLIDEIEISRREGEIARVTEKLPMKLIIFDGETVVYSLDDPLASKPSVTATIVKHSSLAEFFKMAFESMWDKSSDPDLAKLKSKLD